MRSITSFGRRRRSSGEEEREETQRTKGFSPAYRPSSELLALLEGKGRRNVLHSLAGASNRHHGSRRRQRRSYRMESTAPGATANNDLLVTQVSQKE